VRDIVGRSVIALGLGPGGKALLLWPNSVGLIAKTARPGFAGGG
jgi:hypothetical protein